MIWTPRTTVAAIIEQQGRFLFVLESAQGQQVINQPAGHLEENETLADAVRREVLEETARAFQPQGLVGIYRWRLAPDKPTFLRYCFHGDASERQMELALDDDIIDTLWLTLEQVLSGDYPLRSPMVLRCLQDYLQGSRHPLEIIHEMV